LTGILTILTLAGVVVIVVTSTGTTDGEPDAVVLSTTLSDRHEHRLMVTGRGQSADAIVSGGETLLKGSSEFAIAVTSVVDTLEESEGLGIEGLLRVGIGSNILNSEMSVANNYTTLESLGSCVIGVVRIREGTSLEVCNAHSEVNGRVLLDVLSIGRADDDGGDHLGCCGNITHGWLGVNSCS
jgi:hypothetical protein